MGRTATCDESFAHPWHAEILDGPPMIAPARQYVYPGAVEEAELGALQLLLRARPGQAAVLTTFALGFADPSLPHGVWSCPNPEQICAVAGGYAYVVRADEPERWLQVPYRPVSAVHAAVEEERLVFAGFHRLWALGPEGPAWETAPLSWEGIRLAEAMGGQLHGFGWDISSGEETPFTVDLKTGSHTGGASTKCAPGK